MDRVDRVDSVDKVDKHLFPVRSAAPSACFPAVLRAVQPQRDMTPQTTPSGGGPYEGCLRPTGLIGARCWGEDSGLIRHVLMDWTTGTPGTAGNGTLAPRDWLADAGDSWRCRAFGRLPWADMWHAYSVQFLGDAPPRAARAFSAACPGLVCFAPSALKTKEATGKRKHSGLPTPSSLRSKKSAPICDICG